MNDPITDSIFVSSKHNLKENTSTDDIAGDEEEVEDVDEEE